MTRVKHKRKGVHKTLEKTEKARRELHRKVGKLERSLMDTRVVLFLVLATLALILIWEYQ